MDESGIQAISNLAVEAACANRINPAEFPAHPNGIQAVLVGDRVIPLEHLQHNRSRFRGKFATTALSEFVAYVRQHSGDYGVTDAAGFIDPKQCAATVFLNLGKPEAPGHGDWTAKLALEPTAAYAALRAIDGKPVSQKQMVEFVEDWADNLAVMYGADSQPQPIRFALPALRSLTIASKIETTHVDRDFGATRSAMEEIEAKSKGDDLPTHLVFRTEPYAGFTPRDFRLRVSILTGDKPAIILRTVAREWIEESIAQEFKQLLLDDVGDAAKLTIGSFTP